MKNNLVIFEKLFEDNEFSHIDIIDEGTIIFRSIHNKNISFFSKKIIIYDCSPLSIFTK